MEKNKIIEDKFSNSDTLLSRLDKFLQDHTGISRRKYAKKIGVDYQKISKILTKHTKVLDAMIVWKMVELGDLNPKWFFTGEGPKKLSDLNTTGNSSWDKIEDNVNARIEAALLPVINRNEELENEIQPMKEKIDGLYDLIKELKKSMK